MNAVVDLSAGMYETEPDVLYLGQLAARTERYSFGARGEVARERLTVLLGVQAAGEREFVAPQPLNVPNVEAHV